LISVLAIVKKSSEAKYHKQVFTPKSTERDDSQPKIYKQFTSISDTFQLLGQYGIRTPMFSVITQEQNIPRVHLPAYAKTANLALPHKKDAGAIFGVVETQTDVEKSFRLLKKFGEGVLYQEVIKADLELILGASRDEQFGLYLAVGLGGSWTNVLSDRSYAFLPTSATQLHKTFQRTKAFEAVKKLAREYTYDVLTEVVLTMHALQKLMLEHPEITELEINPLMITKKAMYSADVKIK
jgi:hypothetical protein